MKIKHFGTILMLVVMFFISTHSTVAISDGPAYLSSIFANTFQGPYHGVLSDAFEHVGINPNRKIDSQFTIGVIDMNSGFNHGDWILEVVEHTLQGDSIIFIEVANERHDLLCGEWNPDNSNSFALIESAVASLHTALICAFETAIELDVDLVTISLGLVNTLGFQVFFEPNCGARHPAQVPLIEEFYKTVTSAIEHGIVIVAAVGNSNVNLTAIPACIPGVHAVAALSTDANHDGIEEPSFNGVASSTGSKFLQSKALYSNYVDEIWIVPVGYSKSGTSFAAPLFASMLVHLGTKLLKCEGQNSKSVDKKTALQQAVVLLKEFATRIDGMLMANIASVPSRAALCSSGHTP